MRIPLAFSMVLMAIYLARTPRAYVDMRVQTLRAVRVEALHEQPVGLAEVLEVFLLLFDQRNVRQKQQTLPFPEQNAAQHADFVHQRLPDACGSAVHQALALQNCITMGREQLRLPRQHGIDVKLVVVDIYDGLGNAIETQITPRKAATNLTVKSKREAHCLLKAHFRLQGLDLFLKNPLISLTSSKRIGFEIFTSRK